MRKLVLIIAALALAACGAPKAPQGQQPPAPAQPSASAPATPTPASLPSDSGKPSETAPQAPQLPALSAAFLIGRWGDNGDCTKDVVLNADGSFHSYTGGEGAWSLNGGTLNMAGKSDSQDLQLEVIDQNTLQITNPDGSVGRSQRC